MFTSLIISLEISGFSLGAHFGDHFLESLVDFLVQAVDSGYLLHDLSLVLAPSPLLPGVVVFDGFHRLFFFWNLTHMFFLRMASLFVVSVLVVFVFF